MGLAGGSGTDAEAGEAYGDGGKAGIGDGGGMYAAAGRSGVSGRGSSLPSSVSTMERRGSGSGAKRMRRWVTGMGCLSIVAVGVLAWLSLVWDEVLLLAEDDDVLDALVDEERLLVDGWLGSKMDCGGDSSDMVAETKKPRNGESWITVHQYRVPEVSLPSNSPVFIFSATPYRSAVSPSPVLPLLHRPRTVFPASQFCFRCIFVLRHVFCEKK